MVNKVKACIFISGTGSNLESIIKSSREYNFPIKIRLIISNNISAKGLKLAKKLRSELSKFGYLLKNDQGFWQLYLNE